VLLVFFRRKKRILRLKSRPEMKLRKSPHLMNRLLKQRKRPVPAGEKGEAAGENDLPEALKGKMQRA
jgi:hypothetical protein